MVKGMHGKKHYTPNGCGVYNRIDNSFKNNHEQILL